jgi:hypothetical protein
MIEQPKGSLGAIRGFVSHQEGARVKAVEFIKAFDFEVRIKEILERAGIAIERGADAKALGHLFYDAAADCSRVFETLMPNFDGLGLNIKIGVGLENKDQITLGDLEEVFNNPQCQNSVDTIASYLGPVTYPYSLGILFKSIAVELNPALGE